MFTLTIQVESNGVVMQSQEFVGSILYKNEVLTIENVEIGRTVKFRCYVTKPDVSGYFWVGESEEVKITEDMGVVSIFTRETNPSGDTTPLTVIENFLPSTLTIGDYGDISGYYFLSAKNKRKIRAGDRYTLTFSANVSNMPNLNMGIHYNVNIFDNKNWFSSGDGMGSLLSKTGGYDDIEIKNGSFSFSSTFTVDREPKSDDIVMQISFYALDGTSVSGYTLNNVQSRLTGRNVTVIEQERDTTPLTVKQNFLPSGGDFKMSYQNDGPNGVNRITSGFDIISSSNARAMQIGDKYKITFNATAPISINGGYIRFVEHDNSINNSETIGSTNLNINVSVNDSISFDAIIAVTKNTSIVTDSNKTIHLVLDFYTNDTSHNSGDFISFTDSHTCSITGENVTVLTAAN